MLDEGRFQLNLTVDDSSVYADEQAPPPGGTRGNPSFRSFRASNSMVLRDGPDRPAHLCDQTS
jgi:hypothetical protein